MEHAAEAGVVAHVALDAAATDRPGKAKPEQLNEATLIRRYRRGLQKVSEQGVHVLWYAAAHTDRN